MTSISTPNPLSSMLDNVFSTLDRDQGKGLDRGEFRSMYEVLKTGISTDKDGVPKISENQEFERMDKNADGQVSRFEMQSTGVLIPAELTDDSLSAMIDYLKKLDSVAANNAALLLSQTSA